MMNHQACNTKQCEGSSFSFRFELMHQLKVEGKAGASEGGRRVSSLRDVSCLWEEENLRMKLRAVNHIGAPRFSKQLTFLRRVHEPYRDGLSTCRGITEGSCLNP